MTPTEQDLIDLAIEYGMVFSTIAFRELSAKAQAAILRQISTIAETITWG